MGQFKRQHINSSLITSVAYDDFSQIMEIVFCYGGIYEYANISPQQYEGLTSSRSVGEYFNQHIRKSKQYRKVRD